MASIHSRQVLPRTAHSTSFHSPGSSAAVVEASDQPLTPSFPEPTAVIKGTDSYRLGPECHHLLLPAPASTGQLGLRVWRSIIPSAGPRHQLVCH